MSSFGDVAFDEETLNKTADIYRASNIFPYFYDFGVIKTPDKKKWVYDEKHHCWIDVSVDNLKLEKLARESVRIL